MKTMKKSVSLIIAALFVCIAIMSIVLVNVNYASAEEVPAEQTEESTGATEESGSFLDTIKEQFDLNAILSAASSVIGVGSIASIIAFVIKLIKSRKSVEANTINIRALNSRLDELQASNVGLADKLTEMESRLAELTSRVEDKAQRLIEHQLYLTSGSKLPDVAKEAVVRILDGKESLDGKEVAGDDEEAKG